MKRLPFLAPVALILFLSLLVPASAPGQAPAPAPSLPDNTLIFAKLAARLDTKNSKPGDRLEAQVTADVKLGHETILKKGSQVVGQIAELQAAPPPGGMYGVGFVFDSVQAKGGGAIPLRAVIRAIAPPPDQGTNAITDLPPGFDGHASANLSAVEDLTAKSEGPLHLPGVELTIAVGKSTAISILSSKSQAIRLDRGSQIVLRVLNPSSPPPPK